MIHDQRQRSSFLQQLFLEESQSKMDQDKEMDALADEAEELDGYFSDTPLDPKPNYPPLRDTFETSVVITNLPKAPKAKYERLMKAMVKLVKRVGPLVEHEDFTGVYMPMDAADEETVGFCMVEYATAEEAENAVKVLEGYKLDKNYTLAAVLYSRAKELGSVETSEFKDPKPPPFVEKPNPMDWLEDPNQRDSFVIRHGRETIVNWFDGKNDPVVDYDGSREKDAGVAWCEFYCHWSPAGSYLATLVRQRGVILWSGKTYEKFGRFAAPGVRVVLFSPQENYILISNQDPNDLGACKIFHIQTGELLRGFPLYPDGISKEDPAPPFLWSHDDKYLARMGKDLIYIYETPTMKLLDKRSLATDGIKEFQWSPSANVLAYWAPEVKNSPAHVDLIEIPSRKQLRQKNLFNVTRCTMVWHDQGDYLAVKVTRHTKSKKTFYNNIELFRLNESSVPVEMLDTKHAVMALVWEPSGSRFAMIHAENPSASKVDVSFYDMKKQVETKGKKGKGNVSQVELISELNKVETLAGRQCNFLFWSPAGTHIIMASLGDSASGTLEFYDVDSKTMVVKEHYRANQVVWDPSGRTVATIVSQPVEGGHFKFAMDNGYILWSFQGKQLYMQSFETFYQFSWRPRESLLSRAEIEKVKKNLKKYEKQFDKADRVRQRKLYLEETKGKRMERSKLREVLQRNREIRSQRRAEYIALLGGYDSEDDANYEIREFTQETILSTKEEGVMG